MFRPQCFSHSRRFAPPCTLQTCFILLPRPRFHLRGFPQQPAELAPHQLLPSCRWVALTCNQVSSPAPAPATPPSGLCSDY
jgi:hypothetical protein